MYDPPLLSGELLQQRDRLVDRRGCAATDVVDRRWRTERRDRRSDDVVDVGEVAELVTAAEDVQRPVTLEGIDESLEGHVRPLSRAEHGEVPQAHHRNTAVAPVDVDKLLRRRLRHPVWRDRTQRRVLRQRAAIALAVHRGGRCRDSGNRPAGQGLEEALGGDEVLPYVGREARSPAGSNARLASEMEHHFDPVEKAVEGNRREVVSDHAEPRIPQ